MTSWIEPPPKRKGMGCFGKGCLLVIVFLILLAAAFFIGVYTGTKPREIPQVQTSQDEQNAVRVRWDEFDAGSRNEQAMSPGLSPTPGVTPASVNRIELTANDINQLISASRKARGKAFVSIDNNVARVQLTIPLEKVGFRGRYLNGDFTVHASPDKNPRNLQITKMSLTGVPEAVLNTLVGTHSVQRYVDEFASERGVTSLTIENNKVILEKSGGH